MSALVLALIWTGFIFTLSLDSDSNTKSSVIAGSAAARVAGIVKAVSGGEVNVDKVSRGINFIIRKAAHLFIYMVLAALWQSFFAPRGAAAFKKTLLPLALCFITACIDEGLQGLAGNRSARFTDCLIDFFGAAMGVLLHTYAAFKYYSRPKRGAKTL